VPPLTLSRDHAAPDLASTLRGSGTRTPHVHIDILPGTHPQRGDWRVWQLPWSRRRRYLAAALLAALVLVSPICVAYRHPIWQQVQLSTVRQPVGYNELYFTASTALPVHVTSKVASEVTFAVQRDGTSTVVRYNVLLTDSQGTTRVGAGSLRLSPAAPSVVVERLRVPVTGSFALEVRLLPSGPDILFHGQAS
jgi:hypothetical protein